MACDASHYGVAGAASDAVGGTLTGGSPNHCGSVSAKLRTDPSIYGWRLGGVADLDLLGQRIRRGARSARITDCAETSDSILR
jgi:hypothetical protein